MTGLTAKLRSCRGIDALIPRFVENKKWSKAGDIIDFLKHELTIQQNHTGLLTGISRIAQKSGIVKNIYFEKNSLNPARTIFYSL